MAELETLESGLAQSEIIVIPIIDDRRENCKCKRGDV